MAATCFRSKSDVWASHLALLCGEVNSIRPMSERIDGTDWSHRPIDQRTAVDPNRPRAYDPAPSGACGSRGKREHGQRLYLIGRAMSWRKCLVRGLVFTALGALVLAAGGYALWTNPSAVRQLVEVQLGERFVRVGVHLGQARMRLLGGILVEELRMTRLDGLDSADFLYV